MPRGVLKDPAYTNARCACGRRYFRCAQRYCCPTCTSSATPYLAQHLQHLDRRPFQEHSQPLACREDLDVAQPASPSEARSAFELATAIRLLLLTLTAKEQRVLRLRFSLDGDGYWTFAEIADLLRVTPERVRQIEVRAIYKLRHPSRSKWIATFVDPSNDFTTRAQEAA